VRRAFLALLAGAVLAGCTGPAATPSPSPGAGTRSSPPVQLTVRAPVDDILSDGEVGLARGGGRDHLGLTQAAEEQQNQPLALIRYRAWGWVDQAARSWSGGSLQVSESVLLLTKLDGARLAFFDYANEVRAQPFQPFACPPSLGLDDCAEARSGGSARLAGRVGPYLFRLEVSGGDVEALAAKQAAKIRA